MSDRPFRSCLDCAGSNANPMDGCAGVATRLAIATEYQGEATPHGHGFASLANLYQRSSLQEIDHIIEHHARGTLFITIQNSNDFTTTIHMISKVAFIYIYIYFFLLTRFPGG